jgi:hypothetical protein
LKVFVTMRAWKGLLQFKWILILFCCIASNCFSIEYTPCEIRLTSDRAPELRHPLGLRFISNIQRARRALLADSSTASDHLKANFLEITVVRIGVWDAKRRDFLEDGQIPKDMGLKSGALFMKFSEAVVLWAIENRNGDPSINNLRLDAMSIRNPALIPLLKALGFEYWPTDPKNLRLEISFSQLLGESTESAAGPVPESGK